MRTTLDKIAYYDNATTEPDCDDNEVMHPSVTGDIEFRYDGNDFDVTYTFDGNDIEIIGIELWDSEGIEKDGVLIKSMPKSVIELMKTEAKKDIGKYL